MVRKRENLSFLIEGRDIILIKYIYIFNILLQSIGIYFSLL